MTFTPLESPAKELSNVKVYYDQEGNASEVMMSYNLFMEILSQLPESDQAYFWSETCAERS